MSFKTAMVLAHLMASNPGILSDTTWDTKEPEGPKNKHNLTPEQIAKIKDMTPKEKKKYLKGLK